ncbi:hypothetical protein GGF31_000433 [Allomyces arbusculus]|nr:hypothetical protein GGF31_000433 [Allomyces arbusculus]
MSDLSHTSDASKRAVDLSLIPTPAPLVNAIEHNWQCLYPPMTLREHAMTRLLEMARNHFQWAKSWNDKESREERNFLLMSWLSLTVTDFDPDVATRRDPDWKNMLKELDYQVLCEPTAAAVDYMFASDDAVPEAVRASLAKHVVDLLDNGIRATLANRKEHLGGGTPAVAPPASLFKNRRISRRYVPDKFQLLPADFAVDNNGKNLMPLRITPLPYEWYYYLGSPPGIDPNDPDFYDMFADWKYPLDALAKFLDVISEQTKDVVPRDLMLANLVLLATFHEQLRDGGKGSARLH